MFKAIGAFVLAIALSIGAYGQSCTTSTCNVPANANDAVFLNALPSSCPTGTTVVNVPAGTGIWTNQVTYNVPANCTDLTIQGASTVNFTGTHGTASYAVSSNTDNTKIQDNIAGTFGVFQVNLSPTANAKFRMTGMTFIPGTGTQKFIGYTIFYAAVPSQLRVDHNHYAPIGGPTAWGGRINGCITGVMDHNYITNASPTDTTSQTQFYMNSNTCNSSDQYGDGTFAASTTTAAANTMEYADNIEVGGFFVDCVTAGSYLTRYNTINSDSHVSSKMHTHGTAQNGGRVRSCRWSDVNNNYFNSATVDVADIGLAGATGVIWSNSMSNVRQTLISTGDERNDGGHPQNPVPTAWGTCGSSAGGPSVWDGNSPSTTGWPCLDGLGRGQSQLLDGQNFSSSPLHPLDTSTGTQTWPNQKLEPIYSWGNNLSGTGSTLFGSVGGSAPVNNRDYFYDCGPNNSTCSGGFTGSFGTGVGTHAQRLTLTGCTAGPGGTFGTSPTGSYGVGFWETDTQTFWVCTTTGTPGTWTQIPLYLPPVYPNPLVCTGNVTAASTSEVDVLAALNSVNCPASVVNIPSGSASWSNQLNYTIPASAHEPDHTRGNHRYLHWNSRTGELRLHGYRQHGYC